MNWRDMPIEELAAKVDSGEIDLWSMAPAKRREICRVVTESRPGVPYDPGMIPSCDSDAEKDANHDQARHAALWRALCVFADLHPGVPVSTAVGFLRGSMLDLEAIKGRVLGLHGTDPHEGWAVFAANALEDVPALVAEIERQRAAIEELRDECRAEAVRSRETGWAQSEWAYAEIAEKLAAILAKD